MNNNNCDTMAKTTAFKINTPEFSFYGHPEAVVKQGSKQRAWFIVFLAKFIKFSGSFSLSEKK